MADLDSKYRPQLESHLDQDEELRGLCVASQQKGLFRGGAALLGTTDHRLLVQPLDRRGNPTAILDQAAVRLEIRTTDGEKLKLMVMRGEGKGLGKLGGGDARHQGLEALAEWFRVIDPS